MKKTMKLLSISSSLVSLLSGCGPGYYYNDSGQEGSNIGGGGESQRYVVLNAIDDNGTSACGGDTKEDGARIFAYTTTKSDSGKLTPMFNGNPFSMYQKQGLDAFFRGINVSPDGYCYYPYLVYGGHEGDYPGGFEALRYNQMSVATADYMSDVDSYQCDDGSPSFASSSSSRPNDDKYRYDNSCDDVVAYPNPNLNLNFVVSTGKTSYPNIGAIWSYSMNTSTCRLARVDLDTGSSKYYKQYPTSSYYPWAATFNDEPIGSTTTKGSFLFTLAHTGVKSNASISGKPEIRSWQFSPSGTIASLGSIQTSTLFAAVINRELVQVPIATTSSAGCLFFSYANSSGSFIQPIKYSALASTLTAVSTSSAPAGKKISSLTVNGVNSATQYLFATMRDGTIYKYPIKTGTSTVCTLDTPALIAGAPAIMSPLALAGGSSQDIFYATGILRMSPLSPSTSTSSPEYAYEGLGNTSTYPTSYLRGFQLSSSYTFSLLNPLHLAANTPDNPTNGVAVGAPN